MLDLNPFRPGDNIVGYASSLVYKSFDGVTRDTGLPYTQQHIAQVSLLFRDVTVDSQHQKAGEAAAWLHDGPEDISGLDVFNPFGTSNIKRKDGIIYLNDLLADAGDECSTAGYVATTRIYSSRCRGLGVCQTRIA